MYLVQEMQEDYFTTNTLVKGTFLTLVHAKE